MPGEFGQVNSYVSAVKMVSPTGELLHITEEQPELLRLVRSSYGLLGIVYEVTFRVRELLPLAVYHETFGLEEFLAALPELVARDQSLMFYMFPFEDKVTVEFRRYNPGASGSPNRHAWQLRNFFWAKAGPLLAHDVEQTIKDPELRYGTIDAFNAVWRLKLEHIVRSDYTLPPDQIIHYPPVSDNSRYTFSFYAFPEHQYPAALRAYYSFCGKYYEQTGYRSNMLTVGYRVLKDESSLLSYSHGETALTIDPVSTGNPGWEKFLDAYNELCCGHGGVPLLNQTDRLTAQQAHAAFGDRLSVLNRARQQYDPDDRLLNEYFRTLLAD